MDNPNYIQSIHMYQIGPTIVAMPIVLGAEYKRPLKEFMLMK